MRSAQWTPEGITLTEREPGPVPEGWARLAVTGCGICGSDLHVYRGMRAGVLAPDDYATPGHEIAGRVIDAPTGSGPGSGSGPAGLGADTIYAVEPWIGCQGCPHCGRGVANLCPDGRLMGVNQGGGLAELVDVPPRLLHPVPDGVGPELASLAEPWAVAVRAVHRAQLSELDERVLVLGGGNIGLLAGVAARHRVARVGVTCRYPHQADLARRFGLEPIDPGELALWAAEHQPGVVIETVGGEADTMTDAIANARPGGRVVVVGVFANPQPTDYRTLMLKELEVVGSFIYATVGRGSEFGAAVNRMGSITGELAALQTHHFPLDQVAEAFTTADDKSTLAVKVTIG